MTDVNTKTEIDTALAQEQLETVLEAMYTAQLDVLGLDATTILATAQSNAIRSVLVRADLCTEAELLNLTSDNVEKHLEEMVANGILDEEVLSFQTADEDDALGEI